MLFSSYYGYDAFGRRTLVQDAGFATMRTLYDGQSFDIIRENEVFGGGDFTTNYIQGSGIEFGTGEVTGERYRYIEGGSTENSRYRNMDGYTTERSRFTGTKTSLYAKGESVAVNRSASTSGASGRAYFGTDILGSVRSATTDSSTIEERYEYDAFGTPYKGDFSNGLDNGYTGKPYDATTGLYNYGYRDYSPETARFTTVDPIRDGSNWFSYVVNDPVNYVDLWGLAASCGTDAAATEETETWVAIGLGFGGGIDLRAGAFGFTKTEGTETVIFTDGDRIISETYQVNNNTSMGLSVSASLNGSIGIVTREFPKDTTDEEIFQSYEGAFMVTGGGFGPVTGGGVSTLDTEGNVDSDSWSGGTIGIAVGQGASGDVNFPIYNRVGKDVNPAWQEGVDIFVEKVKDATTQLLLYPPAIPWE